MRRAVLYAAVAVAIGVGFILCLSQSNWLKGVVQRRIAAAVQEATGGRVELKDLQLQPSSLTVEMSGFVLHGTESGEGAPLFQANLVRVQLQITSLLRRDVRIASLRVEAPQVHLLFREDGTTNFPSSRPTALRQLTNQLLRLRAQRVRLEDGLLQINDERVPVDLTANDLALTILHKTADPAYTLQLASPEMDVRWANMREIAGSIQTDAQLMRDRFTLKKVFLRSRDSHVELSGSLRNFVRPVMNWTMQSQFAVPQIAAALRIPGLKSGTVNVNGSGNWDFRKPLSFSGEMQGRNLPQDLKLQSKLVIQEDVIRLSDLDVAGPNVQWRGKAELTDYRKLALRGELIRLNLRTAAAMAGVKNLRWSAVARGPVEADGLLRPGVEGFVIKGNLQLAPAAVGPPVSGNLSFAYQQRGNLIELADSKLHLPGLEVAVAGVPGTNLKLLIDSTDLRELRPLLPLLHAPVVDFPWPVLLHDGMARFEGSVSGNLSNPRVDGVLALTNFQMDGANWQNLRSAFSLQKSELAISSLTVQQDFLRGRATGRIALSNWHAEPGSVLQTEGEFSRLDVEHFIGYAGGSAAGSFHLTGTLADPTGNMQVGIVDPHLYKEHLQSLAAAIKLGDGQLQVLDGRGKSGSASLRFSGGYRHQPGDWKTGAVSLDVQSNVFPVSDLLSVRQGAPGLAAQTKIDGRLTLLVAPGHTQLGSADGSIALSHIVIDQVEYGRLNFQASTQGQVAEGRLEGDLRGSRVSGTVQAQLTSEMPVKARLQFGQMDLQALIAVLPGFPRNTLTGSVRGGMTLEGPLRQWESVHATVKLDELRMASPEIKGANLVLRNSAPISLEAANGAVTVQSMELSGPDTKFSVSGLVPFLQNRPMQLKVNGNVDLRIAELFSSGLESSGQSKVSAVLGGTLSNPTMTGTVEFQNGNLSVSRFSNGLSNLNGTVEFNRNRATLRRVTAHFGGGNVALGGFVTFSAGHPFVYRLEAAGQNVRVRYANGVSVTGTSQLALTGTSQASVLSGTATVSRIIFNPSTDVGALLASTAGTESINNPPYFLSGLQFDIHVDSAPDIQLSTSLSRDVQATVDLQLRGNVKNPVLLGSIEANEGDIRVFGGRYTINRGQISFTNPARIEPALDLDLRTQARGINVDITISGTLNKLNINYRSDPPLQPRDIIALLTVGRAPSLNPNTPDARLANTDVGALQSGANTVLGQAISPNSSRLQKLFGIANIKIDPLVQGITNTSQGRLMLEQQISRQITVTYVTNLSQTSEQIFRVEYALNPQFSLVALRDDNGEFGIDIQYKKRFK